MSEYYALGPYGIVVIPASVMEKHPEWMYFVEELNEKLAEEERIVRRESDDDKPF